METATARSVRSEDSTELERLNTSSRSKPYENGEPSTVLRDPPAPSQAHVPAQNGADLDEMDQLQDELDNLEFTNGVDGHVSSFPPTQLH